MDKYNKEPTARWYNALSHIFELSLAFVRNEFVSEGVAMDLFNMSKIKFS